MASRFTALHVGRGESFLLETRHQDRAWAILVDAGDQHVGKGLTLAGALDRDAPKLDRIDIAVCTHNDTDHAGGFADFLDHWVRGRGRQIGELWLPGRWVDIVEPLLTEPADSVQTLEREIRDLINEHRSKERGYEKWFDQLCEAAISEEAHNQSDERPGSEDGRSWPISEDMLDRLRGDIIAGRPPSKAYDQAAQCAKREMKGRRGAPLFYRLVDAGAKIVAIAEKAMGLDIPVRWMDASRYMRDDKRIAAAGTPGLLEVVNAVEASRAPPIHPAMSSFGLAVSLNLTIQNVESLVLYRPQTEQEPGVLFTADSALRSRRGQARPAGILDEVQSPDRPIIITVPHHGSASNDDAYSILDTWLGRRAGQGDFFVRHGAHKMPLTDKLKTVQHLACASCMDCPMRLPRAVTLSTSGGNWQDRGTARCYFAPFMPFWIMNGYRRPKRRISATGKTRPL